MNLLSLKFFVNQNVLHGYLNCFWNYFRTQYIDVRWRTSKTIEKRRCISPRLPFHYSITFIPSLTKKFHLLITFVVFSLSNELNEENIETNCRSNVTRTLYRRILKFFKQAGKSRIWMSLFFKCFLLWVNQSFMSLISGTEIVW